MKQVALVENDMVLGFAEGDVSGGVEIPKGLENVEPRRLRYADGKIVDVKNTKTFWVNPATGEKHVVKGGSNWRKVDASWDDEIVKDGANWRAATKAEKIAPRAQMEMQRRMQHVMNIEQLGVLVSVVGKLANKTTLTAGDKKAITDLSDWVDGMTNAMRQVIEAEADDVFDDKHWPKPPKRGA